MECSYTIRNELKFIIKINDKWNIFTCKHLLEMHEYDIFFRPIKWIIIESSLFFLTYMYVYIFNHFLLENKTKKKNQTHLLSTVSSLHKCTNTTGIYPVYTDISYLSSAVRFCLNLFRILCIVFLSPNSWSKWGGGGAYSIYTYFLCIF